MDAVNRMISATKRLERGPDPATDPKFEFCDRVRASRAFLRCWDPAYGPKGGAPTGETIVAGHERVWGKHLDEIRMAQGRMVGTRIGHRRAEENKQRGGRRERGKAPCEGQGQWMHPDLRLGQNAKFERCAKQARRAAK